MDRTLKFRVWDKKEEKMSYSHEGRCFYMNMFTGQILFGDKDRYVIQQFTGLLDKNGKEAYEGDTLTDDEEETFDAVYFKDGCYWVDDQWLYDQNDHCKVVGNIFEGLY